MAGRRFLKAFSIYDLIFIAMLVAMTLAIKTVAGVLVRAVTGPLGIPGGALAGGFYMMWLPLAVALIRKRGAAFTVSLVETVILIITNTPGSHGIWTFITYLVPALSVELIMLFNFKKDYTVLHFVVACALANLLGTLGSNLLFFQLSGIPLLFILIAGGFSGAIGGVLGYLIFIQVEKTGLMKLLRHSGAPIRIAELEEEEGTAQAEAKASAPITEPLQPALVNSEKEKDENNQA